jgi:hypothetical protein
MFKLIIVAKVLEVRSLKVKILLALADFSLKENVTVFYVYIPMPSLPRLPGPESDKAGFAAWVQELHAAFSPQGTGSCCLYLAACPFIQISFLTRICR